MPISMFAFLALPPVDAWAHLVNTKVGEFYAGMLHPLTSLEHLLPAIAISILTSQCGKQTIRVSLLLFPLSLVAGIYEGGSFTAHTDFFLAANLGTLVVLGVMLDAASRISPVAAGTAVALSGLILRYRSGIDMAASNVNMKFVPGVALTGLIIVSLFSALTPGHGKAIVAAYLVGAGSTPWHAHHHHHHHDHHDHSHMPPGADGTPVTWRTLLGLGVSGGLVPCPSEFVVLLAAISFGRTGFGLVLVIVFSLGLAVALKTVGLFFLKGAGP